MNTRGFQGRRSHSEPKRLPPGQHLTSELSGAVGRPRAAHPVGRLDLRARRGGRHDDRVVELGGVSALGPTEVTVDIHCVTRWSKFDTDWRGVTVDRIFEAAGLEEPPSPFVMAFCDGGYTTNLPVEDLLDGKALVAWEYDGEPLEPEHGGPARLLVPHLYFWKSAKWVRGLRFMEDNEPGFWEANGYHSYGDPWREQRYDGD